MGVSEQGDLTHGAYRTSARFLFLSASAVWPNWTAGALSLSVALHSVSDRAVTLHRLSVDKHVLIETHTHTHWFHCGAVLLGQWSREWRNVPLARPSRVRSLACRYTHGDASSPLSVRTAERFFLIVIHTRRPTASLNLCFYNPVEAQTRHDHADICQCNMGATCIRKSIVQVQRQEVGA